MLLNLIMFVCLAVGLKWGSREWWLKIFFLLHIGGGEIRGGKDAVVFLPFKGHKVFVCVRTVWSGSVFKLHLNERER